MTIETVVCGDCGERKPITDYPIASVGRTGKNYYKPDHNGIPRRRNRCKACQTIYNRKAKERQRDREAKAIEEAKAVGSNVAFIPLDEKAPKHAISNRVGNIRKIIIG